MAEKAERKMNPVTATVPRLHNRTILLSVPEEVAVSLVTLLYKVGGSPFSTYRGHADFVREALESVGVDYDRDRFSGGLVGGSLK